LFPIQKTKKNKPIKTIIFCGSLPAHGTNMFSQLTLLTLPISSGVTEIYKYIASTLKGSYAISKMYLLCVYRLECNILFLFLF